MNFLLWFDIMFESFQDFSNLEKPVFKNANYVQLNLNKGYNFHYCGNWRFFPQNIEYTATAAIFKR